MKSILLVVQNLLKPYIDNHDRAAEGIIAPVETDATDASKAYTAGKQLILNNVLYNVIAPIAQHDALVVGTNITAADDITTQLSNSGITTDANPTKDSTNAVQSGGVYNAEKATREIIAPVEEDATDASAAYSVGAQLILNGLLYNVTAPIAQHDALVVGTNISRADDITTQIKNVTVTTDATPTKDSTNPVQSGGVYTADKNIYAVMGQNGAKNLIPFDLDAMKALNVNGTWTGNVYNYHGVDFTVNADGSILADGQATGGNASIKVFEGTADSPLIGRNLILSGSPSGGSASTYRQQAYRVGSADGSSGTYFDDGDGSTPFTYLNNASGTKASVAVAIYENYDADNLLFKPMLRDALDTDETYQPASKTNQQLTAELDKEVNTRAILGAHNLLNYDAWKGVGTQDCTATWENNGVTLVASANDAWTKYAPADFNGAGVPVKEGETYVLTWDVTETGNKGNVIIFPDGVASGYVYTGSNSKRLEYTIPSGVTFITWRFGVANSGDTVHYKDIQITLKGDAYDGYLPCAKTNQQLTAENQTLTNYVTGTEILTSHNVKAAEILADGVKTYNEMMESLATAFNNYIATLPSDISVQVSYIDILLIGALPSQQRPSTLTGVFNGFNTNGTTAQINVISKISSGWKVSNVVISSSGVTYTNNTNAVPASNTKFSVYVDLYKTKQ